jgi:hypothetical protein
VSGEIRYLVVESNRSCHLDGTFKHTRCFLRDDTQRRIDLAVREAALLKTLESAAVKVLFTST